MDKFLIPVEPPADPPKPIKRRPWNRIAAELSGRFESGYRHDMAGLLMSSYSEMGSFPHSYHVNGRPCPTNLGASVTRNFSFHRVDWGAITGLDFDNKGYYLASVTKSGCLTVHDFEALYCHSNTTSSPSDIESKNVTHLSLHKRLDSVKWNICNQNEIACSSIRSSEVPVFDIGHVSSEPSEILRAKNTITIHGSDNSRGFTDISFTSNDSSRVFASDTHGSISVWDRRASTFPSLHLMTNSHYFINSIQLSTENQTVFGAGLNGMIYMWDIRGGKSSSGFQSHREASNSPFATLRLASELEKIDSLKAQSEIVPSKIQWIGLDPTCLHQLAFHLDDGWSGVLDVYSLCVTHLHCPPPPWLDDSNPVSTIHDIRKAAWLPTCSIYVVGSATEQGIYLLDFFPDVSSPSHVDYDEDNSHGHRRHKQNRFLPMSEGVSACASHPLNGTVIAGTKNSSLLLLSQRHDQCTDN